MIGHLRGKVLVRDPLLGIVLLDVAGVGYQITVSWQTFASVPEAPEACSLWIHTQVREDVLALYGFASPGEKRMFQLLTSVPQVGPKAAVSVLGGFPLLELLHAVADGEQATLQRIPGVGKRTAERIILDLREKMEALIAAVGGNADAKSRKGTPASDDQHKLEARVVLTNLGWKAKPVDAAIDKALQEDPPPTGLDAIVRRSLSLLMAR